SFLITTYSVKHTLLPYTTLFRSDVQDKYVRVANFHKKTLHATVEMMEACGINASDVVSPTLFYRKTSTTETKSFQEIYFNSSILDRKSTRLNSSHVKISYAVFCL